MTISYQRYFLSVIIIGLLGLAIGRYSVQSPTVKLTKTEDKTTDQQTLKDTHTKTVITTMKQPNGATQTTETIDTNIIARTNTEQIDKTALQQTTTPAKTQTLNLSVLAAVNPVSRDFAPVYGVSLTKEFIGPVTIGAFGLTNGTLGVSIGLNF